MSSKSYTVKFVQAAWSSKSFDWLFTKKRVRTSSSGNVMLLSDLPFDVVYDDVSNLQKVRGGSSSSAFAS